MHTDLKITRMELTAVMDGEEARDVLVALRRGCKEHLDVDDGGRGARSPDSCGSCRLALQIGKLLR